MPPWSPPRPSRAATLALFLYILNDFEISLLGAKHRRAGIYRADATLQCAAARAPIGWISSAPPQPGRATRPPQGDHPRQEGVHSHRHGSGLHRDRRRDVLGSRASLLPACRRGCPAGGAAPSSRSTAFPTMKIARRPSRRSRCAIGARLSQLQDRAASNALGGASTRVRSVALRDTDRPAQFAPASWSRHLPLGRRRACA